MYKILCLSVVLYIFVKNGSAVHKVKFFTVLKLYLKSVGCLQLMAVLVIPHILNIYDSTILPTYTSFTLIHNIILTNYRPRAVFQIFLRGRQPYSKEMALFVS